MKSIRRNVAAVVLTCLASAWLAAGCGDDTTVNVNTPEGQVIASVSGRVISMPSGTPLPQASIEILGSSSGTTADSDGVYRIEQLGPGDYNLLVSSPGHARSKVSFAVDGPTSPGVTEVNLQRDLYVIETTASLSVKLFTGTGQGPAAGATVDLSSWVFPTGAYGHSIDYGAVPSTAQADSNGAIALSGIPATTFQLTTAPYDADGDGFADFGATARSVTLRPNESGSATIVLPVNTGSVEILQTNVPSNYSGVLTDASMEFVFSTNLDPAATTVTLTKTSYPSGPIGTTLTWSAAHVLEITPAVPFVGGYNYSLSLYAVSAAGVRRTYTFSFGYQDTGGDPSGGGTCPDVVTDLALGTGQAPIDYDTKTVALEWTAVPCAGGYRLYATDDRNNSSGWIFLKNEPTDFEYGLITTTVALPAAFDLYGVDGIQTPFAGTNVTFAVVPMLALDPAVESGHGQLAVGDQTAPSIGPAFQSGDGSNLSASPMVLELHAAFSEYIDPATPDPVIEIQEAGGDPAFVLDPANGTWTWQNGRHTGNFRFTLLPGQDASGDQFRIVATDLTDFSGNVTAGQSATAWTTIRTSGSSFDFEGSGQSWTVTGTGWEWGTPLKGPTAAHSGTGCFGTDLDADTQFGWNSSLRSPPVHVPSTAPTLDFWYWSYFGPNQYCEVKVNGQILATLYTNPSWNFVRLPLDSFANQVVTIEFRFDSLNGSSYSRDGIFVDDVKISGGP